MWLKRCVDSPFISFRVNSSHLTSHQQVSTESPCGFCGRLQTTGTCKISLSKKGKTYHHECTGCTRSHAFSYGQAARYTKSTPSSNVPVECELCDKLAGSRCHPAIWKYNLPRHIRTAHPGHWDGLLKTPINLPPVMAINIVIEQAELDTILGGGSVTRKKRKAPLQDNNANKRQCRVSDARH